MGYFNIYGQYVQDNSELYHHGILGMRWGHKNGPPYPIGASEEKAGWRKSLDKIVNEGKKYGAHNYTLNQLDQKKVELERDVKRSTQKWYRKQAKETEKFNKALARGASEKQLQKYGAEKEFAKVLQNKEKLDAVKKELNSYIKYLSDKGYTIESKKIQRDAAKGKAEVAQILGGPIGQIVYRSTTDGWKLVEGTGYKAISPKQQEKRAQKDAEKGRADAINDVSAKLGISPVYIDTKLSANAKKDNSYFRRNPDEAKSFQTSVIKKNGGIKVSQEYADAYGKAYDDALKKASSIEFKSNVNKQKLLDDAKKSKPSFRINNSTSQRVKALRTSGMTYEEIAKRLGISTSTVSSMLK